MITRATRAPTMALASVLLFVTGCGSGAPPASGVASESALESNGAFVAPATYADLLSLDPAFPFGVIARHAASGAVLGARWGAHGGPVVTTAGDVGNVLRYGKGGGAATGLVATVPAGLPTRHFWGVDGFVDVPFAGVSMRAYTTSEAPFAGELFLFGADLASVRRRVAVNGFYSGVGIDAAEGARLVYAGLSGLEATASAAPDNGLWSTPLCPEASGSCGASAKLFGWNGLSGPVAADADGNVFVAAFVTGSAHSDAVYGATKTQVVAGAPIAPSPVAELDSNGTSSFVALGKGGTGWLLGKGYDANVSAPIWAQPYFVDPSGLFADGDGRPRAIVAASEAVSLSLFAAPDGHLWVAAEANGASAFLELAHK